ncbi:MAG: hypothetical protein DRN20_04200 [Thermoplasmata archaeon]|nr:MAG: hypothetical protein DRN20_04200 [Thermoplasmata archaeon]
MVQEEKRDNSEQKPYANPAPLGLMGFGMTTVLLNLHNIGIYPLDSVVLALGIFYGGFAQILAGVMEFKRGNTFATTAFTSYGLFWLSFVYIVLSPPHDRIALATYLLFWGIFTLWMFFSTLRISVALQVVFITLAMLFFILATANYAQSEIVLKIGGYEGVFCGLSAIYLAMAEVANEVYGREIFPVGRKD